MDFNELMNLAASKHENLNKNKNVSRYSLDLPAPRKEDKVKPKSLVIQNLLKEKEREKEAAERAKRERQEEENKKNKFKIPKKKPELPIIDKESLINSLFDDGDGAKNDIPGVPPSAINKHSSKHKTQDSLSTSGKVHSDIVHSDKKTENTQNKSSTENSLRKHDKHHSSSADPVGANNKLKSQNQSKPETKSSHLPSSSSKHGSVPNGDASVNKAKSHNHTSETKSSHPSSSSTTKSGSISNGLDKKKPADSSAKQSEQKPSEMTEREKILAKLQAIKQRTLEAIQQENAAKGRRVRGEKSHRKSKSDEKQDEKLKSVEIIKDRDDSEDDNEVSNIPSALDIMLSEHNAKLEKEKISRLAKQAWERATKKSSDTEEKVKKKSLKSASKGSHSSSHKHKSSHKDKKSSSRSTDSHIAKVKHKTKIIKSSASAPPPLDFKAILAMAEEKQKAPPKPLLQIPKKKKEEEERPLTQEEKDRKERQKSREYQEWLKKGGQRPGTKDNADPVKASSAVPTKAKTVASTSSSTLPKHSQAKPPQSSMNNKARSPPVNENILICGPEAESEEEENPAMRGSSNPFDKIVQQVHKKRQGPKENSGIPSKKRIIDSEEEEDSDMDSFIDDGDCELDYSSEIQKMFGYNKNKYKDEDEGGLSDMEADFKTVMMEEKRSAKLGLLEDLEDIKREQEELRMKALKKKMMKKGR
ncbi:protein SPT2 [Biomphalaria glabrata]|nr:putative protein SPT2 [Biomphalaria glabrata]KAI8780684.1 protein SPT2 [Biomphalaria glabrata]